MTETVLELKQVVYQYPQGAFVLRIDHLALNAAEITLVRGDNGSGKSTLAKLMAGIYRPTQGQALVAGRPTETLSLGQIGQRIGYLWQKPEQQLFAHNVLEELLFVNRLKEPAPSRERREAAAQKAEEAARYWLRLFEIEHLAQRNSFFLSRGEKQRVALAAILHQGAGYLILDEPTTGLDPERKGILAGVLTQLKQEKNLGMAIISHDQNFMAALADRTITLAKGEIAHAREFPH